MNGKIKLLSIIITCLVLCLIFVSIKFMSSKDEIINLNNKLQASNNEIKLYKLDKTNLKDELDDKYYIIKDKNKIINKLSTLIEDNKNEIEKLNKLIKDKDDKISKLDKAVIEGDKKIEQLNSIILVRDKQIEELNKIINKKQEELKIVINENENLRKKILELEKLNDKIELDLNKDK